jgi:hypothetical protein
VPLSIIRLQRTNTFVDISGLDDFVFRPQQIDVVARLGDGNHAVIDGLENVIEALRNAIDTAVDSPRCFSYNMLWFNEAPRKILSVARGSAN